MVGIVHIQRVGKLLQLTVYVRPQRHRPLGDLLQNTEVKKDNFFLVLSLILISNPVSLCFTDLLQPLLFTVAQESPEQAAVQMVQDGDQEVFVKLERCRELGREELC